MKLIKFIVPTALVATLALCAPRANAQTMGEYAATTAGASSGASSMGTTLSNSVATSVDNSGGGSSTWGASGVGASFDDRAGAAASAGGGDFESRAGSSSSGSGDSRWPESGFNGDSSSGGLAGDTSDRFAASSDRFADTGRFTANSALSDSTDRFPSSSLDDHQGGLDTEYNAVNNF